MALLSSERGQALAGNLHEALAEDRARLHQPVGERPVEDEEACRRGRGHGSCARAREARSPVDRGQLAEELDRFQRTYAKLTGAFWSIDLMASRLQLEAVFTVPWLVRPEQPWESSAPDA